MTGWFSVFYSATGVPRAMVRRARPRSLAEEEINRMENKSRIVKH